MNGEINVLGEEKDAGKHGHWAFDKEEDKGYHGQVTRTKMRTRPCIACMGDKDFETLANWGKKRDRKLNMSDRDQDHDMDKDEDMHMM